jgi:hypothetical protein
MVQVRASVTAKQKRPGVKKPLTEIFTGSEPRRSVGDFVTKERVIDRANDRYREKVVTDEGEVLRDVDEPLSQHKGRGSDKPKEDK